MEEEDKVEGGREGGTEEGLQGRNKEVGRRWMDMDDLTQDIPCTMSDGRREGYEAPLRTRLKPSNTDYYAGHERNAWKECARRNMYLPPAVGCGCTRAVDEGREEGEGGARKRHKPMDSLARRWEGRQGTSWWH